MPGVIEGYYSFLSTPQKKRIKDMEFGIRLAMDDYRHDYDLPKGLRDIRKEVYWRIINGQMRSYAHLSKWVAEGYELISGEAAP